MRIIGGDWRGRRLADVGAGDRAAHLRPTSDRVREAIFNLLAHGPAGNPVPGARVLDLFAGTGALGLEALSRGAASATFVERGHAALALLRANVAALRAEAQILATDATRLGRGEAHGLCFCDPPYGSGLGEAALTRAAAAGWLADDAAVVWEDGAALSPPPGFDLIDRRAYGGTVVHLMRWCGTVLPATG